MDFSSLKNIGRCHVALVAWRFAILYILLLATRIVFYVYNRETIGSITFSEGVDLFRGALTFDTVSILYANGLWLVLSLLPTRLRVKEWYQNILFGLYVVVNFALIIAVNLSDAVYFHFSLKRFTAAEGHFNDNNNSLDIILKTLVENWWVLTLGILFFFALAWAYGRRIKPSDTPSKWYYYYPSQLAILALAAGLSIGGIRGGFGHDIRPLTLSNAMQFAADNEKSFLILSNPFCIFRTIGKSSIEQKNYFTKEEADKIFSPYHYPTKEEAEAAKLKGHNVLLFILESFSAENSAHLSPELYKQGDEGYMPFLDSLMQQGVTLRRNYANGARSISATPAILGSIPSFETPFVLMSQSIAKTKQMPQILKNMGYSTSFFCGSSRSSMGFAAYSMSAGVDTYFSMEDYIASRGQEGFDGSWGIWDEEFMDFMGEELSKAQKPFFSTMFSISTHHPFKIPERYEGILPKGSTQIHSVTAYADNALRLFFKHYGEQDWFKNTLFVFVADHVSSEKMSPETHKYPGNHHIIGGFYSPNGTLKGEITQVTQQIDLMPTILSLVGNEESYFAFGRDIFGNEKDGKPRWSVAQNGVMSAYTSEGEVITSDKSDTLKAFEQQYFYHLANSLYLAPEKK